MKYFLLLIIPLLTNGAHILPSLFKFDPPTGNLFEFFTQIVNKLCNV